MGRKERIHDGLKFADSCENKNDRSVLRCSFATARAEIQRKGQENESFGTVFFHKERSSLRKQN